MSVILSPSQERVKDAFKDFILDEVESEMVISGFAGSGKSFLVKHLYDVLKSMFKIKSIFGSVIEPKKIYFTATTNKAAAVLRYQVGERTQTIHSLLGLKVTNDFKTGKTKLIPQGGAKDLKGVIFIDEVSMLDKELLNYVRQYARNAKVIYIGDNYQLSPIYEQGSVIFKSPKVHKLTEIQRQAAGNPVIQMSAHYRKVLDKGLPFSWPEVVPDGKHIFKVSGSEFEDLIKQKYTKEHGPEDLKVLAYRNKTVIAYNTYIRNLLGRSNVLELGEQVICNKPVMVNKTVIHPSDTLLTITYIQPTKVTLDVAVNVPGFSVRFEDSHFEHFMPESWFEMDGLKKHFAKHKDWKNYFKIKDEFLDLRPVHASTCHKSQGSTYKEVFIDLNDINSNTKYKDIARLVYVAITRASNSIYVYGDLKNRWKAT